MNEVSKARVQGIIDKLAALRDEVDYLQTLEENAGADGDTLDELEDALCSIEEAMGSLENAMDPQE